MDCSTWQKVELICSCGISLNVSPFHGSAGKFPGIRSRLKEAVKKVSTEKTSRTGVVTFCKFLQNNEDQELPLLSVDVSCSAGC